MAGAPTQSLSSDDVFVDSDAVPVISAADVSALRVAAGEVSRCNALSNRYMSLSHSNFRNDDSRQPDNDAGRDAMNSRPPVRPIQLQFRTHTIAPSPPLPEPIFEEPTPFSADDPPYQPSPLGSSRSGRNPLQITTDIRPEAPARTDSLNSNYGLSASSRPALQHKSSTSSLYPISRTPSFKRAIANNIGSACSSAVASPIITAMGDLTPLPSPLLVGDSPGPWRRLGARPPSREAAPHVMPDSVLVTASGESVASAMAHQSKRKVYAGLNAEDAVENGTGDQGHGRNRSISEYIPDPMAIPKRHVTVSGSHPRSGEGGLNGTDDHHMRREPHLSATRGLGPAAEPPTPPPSESSQSNEKKPKYEFFEAYGRDDKKLRRWRAIKKLGEGTFSRVMLATSQTTIEDDEGERPEHTDDDKSSCEPKLKTLVAVKVCEHGPRGGASETRIEMSLKRELEIMQSIHHPSIVHLKAWNIEQTRALLVLSYCPGGDLFDVATRYRELLTPPLLRRIFAELVGAVRYLHERRIVHRDIKLENVLVNIPVQELAKSNHNWATYPDSIITLTDLGLSRRVADDEKLETRCGSDDYAAPEVILGQPYDGRAIDAWSMGVLLYALLESRLPFDPPPGASDALRMRSRTSHRIARIEWRWIEYAGDDGDHEGDEAKFKAKGLKGAMEVTEGLLKRARSRWPLETVAESEWVRDAIRIQDGPKFKEEEEGEEVL